MALPQLLAQTAVPAPSVAAAADGPQPLDIDVPHQEQDNWCWCAVTLGVSRFFERDFPLSQCETAARILSIGDACSRPGDDDVNRLFDLEVALRTFGHVNRVISQPLTFDEVNEEISKGLPIGVQIFFRESGVRHFTVIRGTRRIDGDQIVVIDDPLHDESEWSFTEFRDFYKGDGKWKLSYLTR